MWRFVFFLLSLVFCLARNTVTAQVDWSEMFPDDPVARRTRTPDSTARETSAIGPGEVTRGAPPRSAVSGMQGESDQPDSAPDAVRDEAPHDDPFLGVLPGWKMDGEFTPKSPGDEAEQVVHPRKSDPELDWNRIEQPW